MAKYRGRSGLLVFNPNKPVRFGYKFFMLIDRSSNFIVNFFISSPSAPGAQKSSVTDHVLSLLSVLVDLGQRAFSVIFDNWFATWPLIRKLYGMRVRVTATMRTNRAQLNKTMPPTIKALDSQESIFWMRPDHTTLLAWRPLPSSQDRVKKPILFATTECPPRATALLNHWDPAQKKTVQVKGPEVVRHYREGMGGSDLANRMMQTHEASLKHHRKWFPGFKRVLSIITFNAFVLYSRVSEGKLDCGLPLRNQKVFLCQLVEQLVDPALHERTKPPRPPHAPPPVASTSGSES